VCVTHTTSNPCIGWVLGPYIHWPTCRYSFLFEKELERGKKYILVEFPHGAFPIGPVVAGTLIQAGTGTDI